MTTTENHKERCRQYYQTHAEEIKNRVKLYDKEHADECKKRVKRWRENNEEKRKRWHKQYTKLHSNDKREYDKQYFINNIERIRENKKQYEKLRCHQDPIYKLKKRLRTRFYLALKANARRGSAVRDLGIPVAEFKQYLEGKFQVGMDWNNYGRNGWHLDHIVPLNKFDLSDRNQLLIALNYTNLQPLWEKDNIVKSDFSVEDFREGVF